MLSINFHMTFKPERKFIGAILEFANEGRRGDVQEIASATGIPMGKSSGKLLPIMSYAVGMGLINVQNAASGEKNLSLTPFGELIYHVDKYLGEEKFQVLAHMNLCRGDIGAAAWHQVFGVGRNILGSSFDREELEKYLVNNFGQGRNRIGPLVSTYNDDNSLKRSNMLTIKDKVISRQKAPISEKYALLYSSYILTLFESFFENDNQVTLTDFNEKTHMFDICLWNDVDIEKVLQYVEEKGHVLVDRHMRPWILEKASTADRVWAQIKKQS